MKQRRVTVRLGLSVLVVFALGCSARGGGGGPIDTDGSTKNPTDASTPTDVGGDPSVATFCGEYCARARSTPGCSEISATCEPDCTAALSRALPACRGQTDALASCVRSAPIVCESPGTMAVPSCNNQVMAVTLCAIGVMNDAGSDSGGL